VNSIYKQVEKDLKKAGYASPVYHDPLYLLAKGTDAGMYRLIPKLVVQVNNELEVITVMNVCRKLRVPLTFKAGGTSLSGQTITDSVLLETGPGFTRFSIDADGKEITLQPGITGGRANTLLAKYHRKIGPSPASVSSAKIGGIIGNNASGASYGIATNSYNTLKGLRLVMADGSILDTRLMDSRKSFIAAHPALITGLQQLAAKVKQDATMTTKISRKYELKNTTGYGLNALLDFNDPLDILWHLMIGSEGTLGFISEATFNTVDNFPCSAAALVFFPDIREACKAISPLLLCEVSAAELMDRNALSSVQNNAGIPGMIRSLDEQVVALLIDTAAPDEIILDQQIREIGNVFKDIHTLFPIEFIRDSREYNRVWKVRKGLFTSVAATRPGGTSCLIEDVAFRPEVLADALVALRSLIQRFGYKGSVMWGHLLDGNVHFVIMPDFRDPVEIEKYRQFMDEFVHLIVHKFDGSLKAEHGTGRNMAPFVKEEWGPDLYDIMHSIKQLFDPGNILNPGVILNKDPLVHIKNLKRIPEANDIIDKCIECGFCENDCPSKNLTLTPRQRIVVYRELHRLDGISERNLKRAFAYPWEETCATDGLCALACPVEINTGNLVKELRYISHGRMANKLAESFAAHMQMTTAFIRRLLNLLSVIQRITGPAFMQWASHGLHRNSGSTIPLWNKYMPGGAGLKLLRQPSPVNNLKVVYFPTCINRSLGKSSDYGSKELEVVEKTINLLHKAGYHVIIPENIDRLCCGMAFDSKGYKEAGKRKAAELEKALLEATDGGNIPVYCDMSPCLLRMKETHSPRLSLYEPVEFILQFLVPRLSFTILSKKVAIHSTCSTTKMGLNDQFRRLAEMCCTEVVVPDEIGCCGWAGDKGFTRPELNRSALKLLKHNLPPEVKEGYSTSRTCEIGLSLHSGITYKSVVYLVDEATCPVADQL